MQKHLIQQPKLLVLLLILLPLALARPVFAQESQAFLTGDVLVMLEDFVPYESTVASGLGGT